MLGTMEIGVVDVTDIKLLVLLLVTTEACEDGALLLCEAERVETGTIAELRLPAVEAVMAPAKLV